MEVFNLHHGRHKKEKLQNFVSLYILYKLYGFGFILKKRRSKITWINTSLELFYFLEEV